MKYLVLKHYGADRVEALLELSDVESIHTCCAFEAHSFNPDFDVTDPLEPMTVIFLRSEAHPRVYRARQLSIGFT